MVFKTWMDWQSFNVGMIALISSIIFFISTKYNEKKQRQRNFIAARASLPQALSDLTEYNRKSTIVWIEAINKVKNKNSSEFVSEIPKIQPNVHSIVKECITQSEFDSGEDMAKILANLQVHHSRITGLSSELSKLGSGKMTVAYLQSNLWFIGEQQARINQLFKFARGQDEFSPPKVDIETISSALRVTTEHEDAVEETIAFYEK